MRVVNANACCVGDATAVSDRGSSVFFCLVINVDL